MRGQHTRTVPNRVGGHPEPPPIRVLHVDDDQALTDLTAEFLEQENERFEVETAPSGHAGTARLETDEFDCVVSDYQMPGMDGLEFLDAVRETNPDVPFILFTGKGSEEIASEAISSGVTDYLQKDVGTDQYTVLANRIENAVWRYRSQRALKDRERRLARAQRIANLGSWEWNIADDTIVWSDQIYRIFGVEPGAFDATRDAFMEFVHPADQDAVRAAIDAAVEGDDSYDIEHRIIRPDGELRVVHEQATVRRTDDGDPVAMAGTVQDITDRRERQRELRAFREAVEYAGHSIYWTDTDGTIQYVNPAFEETTGYSREEAVGANPRILNSGHHDEPFYAEMWDTITSGDVWRNTVVNQRKNGERYVADQTIAPIESERGEIDRFVAVNVTISGDEQSAEHSE